MDERAAREAQMKALSSELEVTLRGLISRIDDGLSVGASKIRDRTDETENRLARLINRVDEGLTAGAAALQESLNGAGPGAETRQRSPNPIRPFSPPPRPVSPPPRQSPSRQPSVAGLVGSRRPTPAATPNLAYPESLQVPGSGLS